MALVGVATIILLVWIFSNDKKNFPFRIVIWGLIIQFILGYFVLKFPIGIQLFSWLGQVITDFLNFSLKSAAFLFGNAANPQFQQTFGFQFAIIVACTVIFFSAFVSILYHFGVMQKIVYSMAWLMHKTMGTSGIESLSASANIFLGQTEAPLLIRHYLDSATRSELNSIMTCGFATIAGGVMAAYISMGIEAKYLITASIISAPGGLILSKILIPATEKGKSLTEIKDIEIPKQSNMLTAVSQGATDGVFLTLNILGMLIAFIAIIAVLDGGLGILDNWLTSVGFPYLPSSLKEFLGYIFMPFAFLVGVPAVDAQSFGSLIGTKISINEFLAYADLSEMIKSGLIQEKTAILATFALCGFANFSSIAIQIGGIGSLAPNRKDDISRLGIKAMFVGALTNLLTTCIAGLML